jgi:hypothetical protein
MLINREPIEASLAPTNHADRAPRREILRRLVQPTRFRYSPMTSQAEFWLGPQLARWQRFAMTEPTDEVRQRLGLHHCRPSRRARPICKKATLCPLSS